MKKYVYVVMSTFYSPVCISIPTPKAVFTKKKDAAAFTFKHNLNPRTSTEYYIRKSELLDAA